MASLDNRSEAFKAGERSVGKFTIGLFAPVLVQRRIRTCATGHVVGLTGQSLPALRGGEFAGFSNNLRKPVGEAAEPQRHSTCLPRRPRSKIAPSRTGTLPFQFMFEV